MNIVTLSTHRRPFHARLSLEALCRAGRWHPWARYIAVCLAPDGAPDVQKEVMSVKAANPDIDIRVWCEPDYVNSPHVASKWMLDTAFEQGAGCVLYVEDDAIVSPDAFVMTGYLTTQHDHIGVPLLGCCLYHETIPEQYRRENRPPDPALLHLGNGINTCGGTAFLREPYLTLLSPSWNCKQVEPRGFDYSAHYLMYLHKLFVLWPDYSRSMNIGWSGGSLAPPHWVKYFGRSVNIQTAQALRDTGEFKLAVDPREREIVLEEWMKEELRHKGLGIQGVHV